MPTQARCGKQGLKLQAGVSFIRIACRVSRCRRLSGYPKTLLHSDRYPRIPPIAPLISPVLPKISKYNRLNTRLHGCLNDLPQSRTAALSGEIRRDNVLGQRLPRSLHLTQAALVNPLHRGCYAAFALRRQLYVCSPESITCEEQHQENLLFAICFHRHFHVLDGKR